MTHLSAHRNAVLCLLGVVAIAGCAPKLSVTDAPTGSPATVSVAPAATSTVGNSAVVQQLSNIDKQLSGIDGQINAANAGLSTSEGDPSQ